MSKCGDKCDKNNVCKALTQYSWRDLFFPEDQDILPPANEIEAWFRRVCAWRRTEGRGVSGAKKGGTLKQVSCVPPDVLVE